MKDPCLFSSLFCAPIVCANRLAMASIDMSLDDIIKKSGAGKGRGRATLRGRGRGGGGSVGGRGVASAITKKQVAGRGVASAITKKQVGRGGAKGRGRGAGAVKVVGRGRGGTLSATRSARGPKKAEPSECLIGVDTDVKAAAGFVANGLREGNPPVVRAISATNLNSALKVLALAHNYLEEERMELYAQVDFPEYAANSQTAVAALHVFNKAKRTSLAKVNSQIFVSASSEPSKVSGYVAKSIRDASLGRVCITACGPAAVLRALKAIFLARHHLRDDSLELSIVPEFGKSEEGLSLLNIFALAHRIGSAL